MSNFVGSIWWLLVTLGVLITFHEYGHFVVARRLGVKVLRFSVGFGRALWKRTGKDGVEYQIAAIPLGGYVKMLDEREGDVSEADAPRAYNRAPVGVRIAIAAAGPAFNLVFALAAFWLMFSIGRPDYLPVVGRADGIAASAGFEAGDRIVAIDDEPMATWSDAAMALARSADQGKRIRVAVTDRSGSERVRDFDLGSRSGPASPFALGLYPRHFLLPAVIGAVTPDMPAAAAGLRPGDRIDAIDDTAIEYWDEVPRAIRRLAPAGETLSVTVMRDGERQVLEVTPMVKPAEDGKPAPQLGVAPRVIDAPTDTILRYDPARAVVAAFGETWRMTGETLSLLGRMISGNASLQNISGPITIAQFANEHAKLGVAWFLSFLGVISLSLAIMNLLPIPVLDGGHLLYYLIELVKGSPLSDRAAAVGQYVGLVLLVGLMGLAFYNDILRTIS